MTIAISRDELANYLRAEAGFYNQAAAARNQPKRISEQFQRQCDAALKFAKALDETDQPVAVRD